MSDLMEAEVPTARDFAQEAFRNALYQRTTIMTALREGKLSCLPGADGFADTEPARNLFDRKGKNYHGVNQLFLKEHTRQNGFPTAEYISTNQLEAVKKDIPNLFPRKGEKGVSIYVGEKNEITGEIENKHIRLFNVAQLNQPWALKKWLEKTRQEEAAENLAFLKTQYGENYKPPEKKEKETSPDIVCSSSDPEKYLGEYLAAVSMGSRFSATPEQAAEFSKKLENIVYKRINVPGAEEAAKLESQFDRNDPEQAKILESKLKGHTNPFKLSEIGREAGVNCKEIIKQANLQAYKIEQPEQNLEQTQKRGRSVIKQSHERREKTNTRHFLKKP